MQSGINDEANAAEQFILQSPKVTKGILVIIAKFRGNPLRVERPTFLISVEAGDPNN